MEKVRRNSSLKKKLFIAGAYLIIAVLLILFVSYSSYRIAFEEYAIMPKAAEPAAAIVVDYNLADIIPQKATPTEAQKTAGITPELTDDPLPPSGKRADSFVLSGLLPGESAKTNMDMNVRSRMLEVEVRNTDSEGRKSQVALQYELVVSEEGVLPLEVCAILCNADGVPVDGKVYTGRASIVNGSKVLNLMDENNKAPVYELPSDQEYTHKWKLYFGWDNTKKNGVSQRDSDLQREVAVIGVSARFTSLAQSGFGTEEELKEQLDGRYKPAPKP